MLKWLRDQVERQQDSQACMNVGHSLHDLYQEKLLPVEQHHDFSKFHAPELTDADFSSRPMVMLLGQYSTGKTTLIKHLLGREYPGLRIGPEPTTEKFVAVSHNDVDQDSVVPGHALVSDPSMPFTQLSHLGDGFLSRFECVKVRSPVLEGVTLIDTPGVLAGQKQRLKRGYEFEEVIKWFADRVHLILLLFDVSKTDISDEFCRVINAIKAYSQKMHIILNKADGQTTSELLRVYGSLLWSLGKVIDTPEAPRVYVGSFWEEPRRNEELEKLFKQEESDLYKQLTQLPRGQAVTNLNSLVRRARLARVHAHLLDALRSRMPTFWRKGAAQQRLLASLEDVYKEVVEETKLPRGDFPDVEIMRKKLAASDFSSFAKVDPLKMKALEAMMSMDIPRLLELIPEEQLRTKDARCILNTLRPPSSSSSARKRPVSRSRSRSRSRSPPRRRSQPEVFAAPSPSVASADDIGSAMASDQ
eukprot:TRINITY_DN90714_c0_g1_i1.p1 TRINITY_DN90714_c0_g1~~TRINITY_DN90714_c0_g1_i1.p1  ORF type:complete len:474 (-),score=90.93 TRINITY_DN90714_c0_g1_i1:112-1533(-)